MAYFAGQKLTAAALNALEGPWSTYTVAWTTSGTQPAIGNGTLAGRYKQIGKLIFVKYGMAAGSTTTFGTSQWHFSLPVNAVLPGSPLDDPYAGTIKFFDNSVPAHFIGFAMINSGSTVTSHTISSAAGQAGGAGAPSSPFTWATNDRLIGSIIYETA